MLNSSDEYGIYIKTKDTQGILLVPIEGSEYKLYHLNPIKINWWWKSKSDNNIKETVMKGL